MNIQYQGEHLEYGDLGYLFVVLSFGAALLGLFAYIFASYKEDDTSWRNIGRISFFVHFGSVIGIFATLFFLIYTHQFQYNYVWSHSSKELPWYYILSCFWEGQEGSFLLWTFWHGVLGTVLIFKSKSWERPVLAVLCLVQVMLASMLLGLEQVSVFGAVVKLPLKLGSNPFTLLRHAFPNLPVFRSPDYVSKITDGRGLNPLLQNYWMVIHPPVLFLGFASTVVPFAFAIAGLWKRRVTEWVNAALPWAVFGGMILGVGILMGGAWAYEALSFGGFWAWDPVENASLVPWIILIAALHTMMIYKAKKTSLMASFFLSIMAFLLILYSTFLTRSGILGDTSVHSFTDLGLSGQLLIFMFLFVVIAIVFMIMRWKQIPKASKEESTYSREFWMFIGALMLSLSALHIISITSIPVINKINDFLNSIFHFGLKTNYAKPSDVAGTYHMLEIPFAIIVTLLTALAQFMRYRDTPLKEIVRKTLTAGGLALVFMFIMAYVNKLNDWLYCTLLWSSFFAIFGNGSILWEAFRKKHNKMFGPSVAHIGFGLIIAGALISNARKEVISINTENMPVLDKAPVKEQMENKVLFKGYPTTMAEYKVSFEGDSSAGNHLYYKVAYRRLDKADKELEHFTLYPNVIFNKAENKFESASPSTRHYLTKDIFTHISSASAKEEDFEVKYNRDTLLEFTEGQSIQLDTYKIRLKQVIKEKSATDTGTYKLTMKIMVNDGRDSFEKAPSLLLQGKKISYIDEELKAFGLNFRFYSIIPARKSYLLLVVRGNRPPPQYIAMKAIVFPYINLLWLGCVVMFVGFLLALLRRIREYRVS